MVSTWAIELDMGVGSTSVRLWLEFYPWDMTSSEESNSWIHSRNSRKRLLLTPYPAPRQCFQDRYHFISRYFIFKTTILSCNSINIDNMLYNMILYTLLSKMETTKPFLLGSSVRVLIIFVLFFFHLNNFIYVFFRLIIHNFDTQKLMQHLFNINDTFLTNNTYKKNKTHFCVNY